MSYSGDFRYGQPATSDLGHGHAPWQGHLAMTVNPANLLSGHHSTHGSIHPYGISHGVVSAHHNFVGNPTVASMPQGFPQYYPAWSSPSMGNGYTLGSVNNDILVGHSTMPPGLVSSGLCACGWVLEDEAICGETVSEGSLPGHLAEHGVHKLSRNCIVRCGWRGCEKYLMRQGILRHCREVHLGVKRRSPRTNM